MLKTLFNALGMAGAIYASIELLRIIRWYWDVVDWLAPFAFEIPFIVLGVVWVIVVALDNIFIERDLLGTCERCKGD